MKEQIEAMAKDLGIAFQLAGTTRFGAVAEILVNAGWLKQSEKYLIKENGDILPLTHHSEWISVDDRMPTECENVLCFEKGKVYVAFLENAEYSAVWWDWVDYDRDDTWTERTPTHWMPLPEPPEMKGGAE